MRQHLQSCHTEKAVHKGLRDNNIKVGYTQLQTILDTFISISLGNFVALRGIENGNSYASCYVCMQKLLSFVR